MANFHNFRNFLADFLFVSDKTGILYAALQDLLAQLTENLSAVPKIICQFVNKLQGTCTFAFLVHLSAAVFLLLLLVLYFNSRCTFLVLFYRIFAPEIH